MESPGLPFDLRSASVNDVLEWRDRIVGEAAEYIERGMIEAGIDLLRKLELATIDNRTLELTDPFLPRIACGRKVVASFDPFRKPAPDEVIIVYGNYPHFFPNIVVNNPIKRHVFDFWNFRHDRVEYDARWESIDQIFVINLAERLDRYDSVLRELASAKAPLNRLTRVPAFTKDPSDTSQNGGTVGCLRSHIEVLRRAETAGYRHILVLEDDFCFTSDLAAHLTDLGAFFQRDYPYWICLIATSKYGPVVPKDDLVSISFQPCTNTAGYLVSRDGLEHLLPVFEQALDRLKATGDSVSCAADRCWAVLQPSEKFFVFRRKFGFQASNFSDIERSISRYLD
jgi:glycosyl transferase family 25